jgi:hypothetical protein
MAGTEPQILLEAHEGIVAEAQGLAGLVKDVVTAAGTLEPMLAEHMRLCASTLTTTIGESLRVRDDSLGLRRLRQTGFLVDELRHATWALYDLGAVGAPLFDEVMLTTARFRREVDRTYRAARHRAYRRLAGIET